MRKFRGPKATRRQGDKATRRQGDKALTKYGPRLDHARQHPEAKKYLLERWNIDVEKSNHWLLSITQDQDFWLQLDKDVKQFIWRITPVAPWGTKESPQAATAPEEAKAEKAKPTPTQEPSSKPKPAPRAPSLDM